MSPFAPGSTAKPKGVMVTHANVLHNQALLKEAVGHTPETVMVSWLPFFHNMGLIGVVLASLYNEAMSLYPVDIVTRQLLTPLLIRLGQRWQTSEGSVAEEHFFSVFMRNKLGARFHHRNMRNTGPRLVAACLPGEQHEFGLLLFALAAHARGYRLILLGANMPLDELPHVIERTGSQAVVLSGSVKMETESFQTGLQHLTHNNIPVFIGGRVAEDYPDVIDAAGAIPLHEDLFITLRIIGSELPFTQKP